MKGRGGNSVPPPYSTISFLTMWPIGFSIMNHGANWVWIMNYSIGPIGFESWTIGPIGFESWTIGSKGFWIIDNGTNWVWIINHETNWVWIINHRTIWVWIMKKGWKLYNTFSGKLNKPLKKLLTFFPRCPWHHGDFSTSEYLSEFETYAKIHQHMNKWSKSVRMEKHSTKLVF